MVYGIVLSFCHLVLKKIENITPVEATRLRKGISKTIHKSYLCLHENRIVNTNIFIGIKKLLISLVNIVCYVSFMRFVHFYFLFHLIFDYSAISEFYSIYGSD